MKLDTMLKAVILGHATAVVIFLCLIGLVIVGSMTADDLTAEQNEYCKSVYEETYPDYKNIFEKDCIEWLTEHNKSVN